MFEIKRYTSIDKREWDRYVAKARNATFLFYRDYMDYHSDRFTDHSLMFYVGSHLHSILPANIVGDTLYSHQGLTYGGLVMDINVTSSDVVTLFREMNDWLRAAGIRRVVYKPVPWVYHQHASEEDLYPLFWVCHAQVIARDLGTVIFMQKHLRWRKDRRRRLKVAHEHGIVVTRTTDFRAFWPVLEANLQDRHGVNPVHTVEEMELLYSRFPENIVQYNACKDGEVLAGLTFYLSPQVLHGQYCSSTPQGKKLGAVDAIYEKAMYEDYPDYMYLDYGRSTEGDGSVLNDGLVAQKEGFGGRAICYDTYEWTL
ncbi:MAG: GNAT family N-acetyltransferase [Prevotella sp.]|nr:GNAT family N-acetyltransferase [Prevotella sp.]